MEQLHGILSDSTAPLSSTVDLNYNVEAASEEGKKERVLNSPSGDQGQRYPPGYVFSLCFT